jgi:hypothetical protein
MIRRVLLAFLLAIALPAYASGDPSVIFFGLAQVLVLGTAIVYIVVTRANWPRKARALLPIAGSTSALVALSLVPDYTRNAIWLEPLSAGLACLGALLAWRLVRRS